MSKRKKHSRAEPMEKRSCSAFYISDSGSDFIPIGYTRLSKQQDVQKCLFKIADLVSNMTIMLMENGTDGDIRIKDELARKVDVYPNKNITRKTFITKIVMDMLNYGNSVVIPRYSGEYLVEMSILPGNSISLIPCEDGYMIQSGGTTLYPDEVLHFPYFPDENYPWRGLGITPLVKDTVKTLLQENATKKGFLQSKWKPSLIISISADTEELQDPELRKKILGSYTDTTEEGEPWLIPAGEIDIKTVQPLTLNDLAIQDGISLDLKSLAAGIGVPGFMVGIGNFNKDEYNNFIATTIMSIATIIQQELTKKLLYSPIRYFKFNPKSLMQYTLSEKMGFVKEMVSGGMLNRNEGRSEFDYSPVNNPGMNDYVVLENYVPVEKVGDQKKLKGNGGDE
ncbi:MAG: phage portal protein [Acetivibrio ethanolgignens]